MNELALHILDLAQNSVAASATRILIEIELPPNRDEILITITDNGCGMDAELLSRVTSPFATTRETRRVGLGIPMVKQLCEACGGEFAIESAAGKGTKLTLRFQRSHIDLPPLGDIAGTMTVLVNGAPDTDFTLSYASAGEPFRFDTAEIRKVLDGVPLNTPDVTGWVYSYISEGIEAADLRRE